MMKKLVIRVTLALLILMSALLLYQNHKLKEENIVLEMEVIILEQELKAEKNHHEGNFRTNIKIIEKLKMKLDTLQAVKD